MSTDPSRKPVCAVVGVGPGIGGALARRFSAAGYRVALLARRAEFSRELAATLGDARSYECDVTDSSAVDAAFDAIRRDLGEVDVLAYNAGSGVFGTVEDITAADLENAFKVNTLGAFLASRQVIPAMKRNGHGSIVFIGATASRRGNVRTAAFAPAKAAQKSLAESMARHLWPAGIHVALIVVDGVVDLPRTRERMPGKPDSFFVAPDGVAETAFRLTEQPRTAWSFEVEARPFGETW